jgi:phosphoribosylformylglycinamidine cyclo-ligase
MTYDYNTPAGSGKDAPLTYKEAGVDTKEGERAVALMKQHVRKTFDRNVLTGLGSFGSLYKLPMEGIEEPVLVSGTDGVGTKLKLAFMMNRHDTVGIDCVAMCVNDILCQGAKPLFFLDYVATGKVSAEKISDIVSGVTEGCLQSGCALVGGETAEMPGFYEDGEYDMAGFCVGLVDRHKIITGDKITEGDVIVGLASSGLHSNGYSLARKLFFDKLGFGVNHYMEELEESIGEALLRPTKIYAKACDAVFKDYDIHGVAHITGGGFYENVPRILPKGLGASFQSPTWPVPEIFNLIRSYGNIDSSEMFHTFNMGIGLMMFVDAGDGEALIADLEAVGEEAYIIGEVVTSEKRVLIDEY